MTIYKIRNKETGQFSSGSVDPRWEEEGKLWTSINAVLSYYERFLESCIYHEELWNKTHNSPWPDPHMINFYDNAEIVEYELRENTAFPF